MTTTNNKSNIGIACNVSTNNFTINCPNFTFRNRLIYSKIFPFFVGGGPPNADGLELVKLQPGVADYFGTGGGVLLADVDEGSSFGLEPGDVILRIGDRAVDSPERVLRILRSYDPDEAITFHVMRNHEEISVEGHRNH